MILTPRFSQLPFDMLVMGGLGYGLGYFFDANAKLSATVLAIGSIANLILFKISDHWIRPQLKISPEAIYTGTNAITTITSVFAARHFELISRRVAGLAIFALLGVFAARLKILA